MPRDSLPNIIFIITDQQRFDTIQALGFDYMDTAYLDRLVKQGVAFTQCHVAAASCAPARASLFTGLYPHTTGIYRNADRWTHSWVEDLNRAGYHCTNIGKMHTWPFNTTMGFDERYVVENKDRYLEGRYYFDEWDKALRARGLIKQQRELYRQREDYHTSLGAFEWKLDPDMHPDMFVGQLASWWIRNFPKTEPLFLQIGFPGPHPPYDPIPRYAEPYLEKRLPLLEVTDEEIAGLPQPFQELRQHNTEVDHDSVVHLLNPTRDQRHRQRAFYLANVTMIDERIGQILQALDTQGYLEDAIVLFTSDHGDCLTDHGQSQKWTMYDIITRVPTIVWSPNRFSGGRKLDGLCQQMDLGATILDYAGIEIPEWMEAQSLRPALESKADDSTPDSNSSSRSPRPFVFAEQGRDGNFQGCEFVTMIRNQRWKLVHFLDQDGGQLFDLRTDPEETMNLWAEDRFQSVRQELLAEIREWRIRSGAKTKDWTARWR